MNIFSKRRSQSKPLFLTEPYLSATLVNGSFKRISALPVGIERDEWIAANTLDFYSYTQQFYSSISEYCDPNTVMNAGVEYLWMEDRKQVRYPPAEYIERAFSWIQSQINNESVYPTKNGQPFPKEFIGITREIFRQLFRILAYIYYNHYEHILHLSSEAHMNTLLAHLLCFAREFDLIDYKELVPMHEFIKVYEQVGRI